MNSHRDTLHRSLCKYLFWRNLTHCKLTWRMHCYVHKILCASQNSSSFWQTVSTCHENFLSTLSYTSSVETDAMTLLLCCWDCATGSSWQTSLFKRGYRQWPERTSQWLVETVQAVAWKSLLFSDYKLLLSLLFLCWKQHICSHVYLVNISIANKTTLSPKWFIWFSFFQIRSHVSG